VAVDAICTWRIAPIPTAMLTATSQRPAAASSRRIHIDTEITFHLTMANNVGNRSGPANTAAISALFTK
jgi:hypothetical protein